MATNFLLRNIKWTFNQNSTDELLSLPTTEAQYTAQLDKLARRYFPERLSIDTVTTEFFLNKIALTSGKSAEGLAIKNRFAHYWAKYEKLRKVFDKKYLVFPASGNKTRLETVAELIGKCSQFAVDGKTLARMRENAVNVLQLSEREANYLEFAVELCEIDYYCAAALKTLQGKPIGKYSLAKMLRSRLLPQKFSDNDRYCQCSYQTANLIAVIDCMGNTATKYKDITTGIDVKTYVYANGRNVFDTFVKSKFGNNTAEFASNDKTVDVTMRYYLQGNCEIRNVTLTNKGKTARKFTLEVPVTADSGAYDYFAMDNALCLANKTENLYVAAAVVHDNAVACCYGDKALNYDVTIESNSSVGFDIVTVYADNSPALAREIESLYYMGTTVCPYLYDEPSNRIRRTDITLNLSSKGYVLKKPRKVLSSQLNYSYQLGDSNVATFVDNAGNSTTLVKGFVFGIKGESVYSVKNGIIDKINEENFHIDVDRLCYNKRGTLCSIRHDNGKIYDVINEKPCKTLFLFPFERKSKVHFAENAFEIDDGERQYVIECDGKVESYTTSALECSEEKIRYKLSNDTTSGTCLAVCFATSAAVNVKITSKDVAPQSKPIIRESLVSTYLNYINDKNAFCLTNYLKRADALTVAAICYTNPQFVKNYLLEHFKTNGVSTYYDNSGRKKNFADRLTFPLAYAYYMNLVGDELPDEFRQAVNGTLLYEKFDGKDLCVKALTLRKLSQLSTPDKVKYLVEYNIVKKQISSDAKLYGYAQAIGATTMTNPSKARLKDLCNKYDIPKCWYYVSQLENLYGLSISSGKVQIYPKVTAENALEQLALNIDGKRIDTTFYKSTVHSMTLNGATCYQPFYPTKLKSAENELVVRY